MHLQQVFQLANYSVNIEEYWDFTLVVVWYLMVSHWLIMYIAMFELNYMVIYSDGIDKSKYF